MKTFIIKSEKNFKNLFKNDEIFGEINFSWKS